MGDFPTDDIITDESRADFFGGVGLSKGDVRGFGRGSGD